MNTDMDKLQQKTKEVLINSFNTEGAIQLHAEILSHLNERFLDLHKRHTTRQDRDKMLEITNDVVEKYFNIGKPQ